MISPHSIYTMYRHVMYIFDPFTQKVAGNGYLTLTWRDQTNRLFVLLLCVLRLIGAESHSARRKQNYNVGASLQYVGFFVPRRRIG